MSDETLSNLLHEDRLFPPTDEFVAQANANQALYDEAAADPLAFWERRAEELIDWDTRWERVLDWDNPPFAKWFVGGKLNVAYNCVDRHVEAGNGQRVALHWVGEPGDTRSITYAQLRDEVSKTANALTELGVGHGDRVAIYLPMIPEAVISMLACARLGAIHSVVFGGFSAGALQSRIEDVEAKLVITSDGGYRRGKASSSKHAADEAAAKASSVEHMLVVRRTGGEVDWDESRDVWWHDIVDRQSAQHTPQPHDAEDTLYVLYTSGSTGKPKGIRHTSGGYLLQCAYTQKYVFDLKPESDVYWCGADIGWVTGHSYIVYGPLAIGATQVMYEGTPDTPHKGRYWEIVDQYKVSILYIAPTLIRTMMKWGGQEPAKYDLSSLRVLGTVGEPINPEAWVWYRSNIGRDVTPVVDTWWQTETGAIMVSPLPGVTKLKPGSAQNAIPGISADVVDESGAIVPNGGGGYLVIKQPWPGMLRGIWGDDQRFIDTYWSQYPEQGYYFAGDGAKKDNGGDIWVLGRVDDVMNVSGHRISTTEVESALVSHPMVAEAAVVGASDVTTGQGIVAFVILRASATDEGEQTAADLRSHVASEIGPIAKPRQIMVVSELPKTRSGKIMRRLLRDVAENRELGDVTTLADPTVMNLISQGMSSSPDEG